MSERPGLIITGATVYVGDDARTTASAVAIAGDRILAVGSDDEVRGLAGPDTVERHLPGRLVTAGFQDAHVHTPFGGRNLLHIYLNDIGGRENYLAAIRAYADAHPEAEWIVGGGWAMEFFPGGLPVKEDLDSIIPDRPVFLFNRDVHGAWVNSRFLEIAGITRDTPDPVDGRIERDAVTGEPTGMLHEGAAYTANDRFVPLPSTEEWEAAILRGQAHLHELGITGWQDAWVTPDTQAAYVSLANAGTLTGRVVGSLWWERSRGLDQIDELVERRLRGGPGFHPTTVKIMTDGVLENYTGALLEPYCDGCGGHTDNSGIAFVEHDLLCAAVTELDRLGFQVHMHAIGDRAVRNSLDAVEAARAANGMTDTRHHIAHIQVVNPADVPRFAQLGVTANAQPYWAQHDGQMTELTLPYLGEERAAQQYPFRDLLRSGARMAMGSDWSVTTANVLVEMDVAVNRATPGEPGAESLLPDQRLTLDESLQAFTRGTAYLNHDDADAGTVEAGKRADLAVVDRNVFESGSIYDARVEMTIASGRVVHDIAP